MMIIIVNHLVLCFVIFIEFLEGYHYLVTTEDYHDDYHCLSSGVMFCNLHWIS